MGEIAAPELSNITVKNIGVSDHYVSKSKRFDAIYLMKLCISHPDLAEHEKYNHDFVLSFRFPAYERQRRFRR
jgi:hypothetical protein